MKVKSTSQKDAKIQSYSLDFKFSVIKHLKNMETPILEKNLVLLGKKLAWK